MDALLWLLLEAGVALGLVLALIWWTLPRRKREQDAGNDAEKNAEKNAGKDARKNDGA